MDPIRDIREKADFSKLTFSNYKKTEVQKEILKAYKENNIESSCYWCAELICSGHIIELWEIMFMYISKFIHIGNPKLCIYISTCIDKFKKIIDSDKLHDELMFRNNIEIRKLFSEISVVLCESKRKHSLNDNNKISLLDFDMSNIGNKLKAPHINYITNIFKPKDTKETYIALNELYYNITENKNGMMACYWIDWIIEFDIMMRKNKKKNLCERRSYIPVPSDEQINIIWMVWDVFFDVAKKEIEKKIITSLLNIFCLKFSKGIPKKRKYIFYHIILLFTEKNDYSTNIISNNDKINKVKDNINRIYSEIKKGEILPKSDYLFMNIKSNKDKSIEKMKILDNMSSY
tara:strand:+ start:10983 stop:12023 length:1041 start_codon:yes stop_codon:yes gene_type:complete